MSTRKPLNYAAAATNKNKQQPRIVGKPLFTGRISGKTYKFYNLRAPRPPLPKWEIDKLKKIRKLRADLVASIHDEYQFEVHKEDAEEFGEVTKLAMKETERKLNVRCPLGSEYKIGLNWAETH